MSSNSDQIRKYIALLESADQSLEEGPLTNRVMAKLGSKRAAGRVDRDQLAKRMLDGFNTWIGKTNRKGTADDIKIYLGKIGFDQPAINTILKSDAAAPEADAAPDAGTTASSGPAAGANAPVAAEPAQATPSTTAGSQPATSVQTPEPVASPSPEPAGTATAEPQAAGPEPTPPEGSAPEAPEASGAAPAGNAPEASQSPQMPLRDLKAARQKSMDKRNYHDAARASLISDHNRLKDKIANSPNISDKDRQNGQIALKSMRDQVNKHSDQFLAHHNDFVKHSAELANRKEPDAASRQFKGNKLLELALPPRQLSRGKIKDYFNQAAGYAHDNELVGSKVAKIIGLTQPAASAAPPQAPFAGSNQSNTSNNSNNGQFGGYNSGNSNANRSYQPQQPNNNNGTSYGGGQNLGSGGNYGNGPSNNGMQGGNDRVNQRQESSAAAQRIIDYAIKEGLTQQAIQQLRYEVQSARNMSKIDPKSQDALKVLGFAFLKTL